MARRAFWSYLHQDDDKDGARMSQLAHDVVDEYNMLTGETISVFLDKDGLAWGDKWREEISDQLNSVEFFIPVMTPRYFKSPECRRELNQFLQGALRMNRSELLLPLHYVDVPELSGENVSEDKLINQLRSFQWFDWREIRLTNIDSEKYRRGVNELACELIKANKKLEESSAAEAPSQVEESPEQPEDAEPGILDRLARGEESAGNFSKTLTTTNNEIEKIGGAMSEATAKINTANDNRRGGFAYRILVARELSKNLTGPIDTICALTPQFESQLQDIDDGIRLMIELAPQEVEDDPAAKGELCTYFDAVRNMSESAHVGLRSIQGMIDSAAQVEKLSRDLRPELRRMRRALAIMAAGTEITDQWPVLIDESEIECP